jgi:hypothetical protein
MDNDPYGHVYSGRERFKDWLKDVAEVPGGTISPGGAVQMMGCSRQNVHRLMREGKIECWTYCERGRAHYVEISITSVRAYMNVQVQRALGEPETVA